ncbi:hypothetical protein D8674_037581 [Pyrus ussuriensis x Pyrus communis]|uniref:C2 domain-containing protein n=1 Tax=Pyrus ussuriensis x Pyrus communis TaxID=2448454 RepID=A0A5N5FSE4_9ROSA|nr:hypothetical protein D8674_037581 [Pyrus ussuriensis x Pyrus communis]
MDCRPLEVIIDSANDLKDVNLFSTMDVSAAVSVSGDPRNKKQKTKTPLVKDGGTNPKWTSYPIRFTVDEDALLNNDLTLNFKLISERTLGDTKIGKVKILLKELLDAMGGGDDQKKQIKHVSYGLRSSSGKPKGTINFGYKFGDKFSVPVPEPQKKVCEPVMAYTIGQRWSSSGYPPAGAYPPTQAYPYPPPGGYPPPPHQQPGYGYAPPPQAGYGYPPQPVYGYPPQPVYRYPPQPVYRYPPQPVYRYPPQPVYGYPPQQVVQPQKPKRGGGGNMARLLGELIEVMIRNVGEMGAYVAGYYAGVGDDFGGGFDF